MLAVSLFLDWWEGVTGFTAFEVLDLVLLALAVVTALALVAEAGLRAARAPVPGGRALPPALLALVIVLVQLVNDPPLVVGPGPGHDTGHLARARGQPCS